MYCYLFSHTTTLTLSPPCHSYLFPHTTALTPVTPSFVYIHTQYTTVYDLAIIMLKLDQKRHAHEVIHARVYSVVIAVYRPRFFTPLLLACQVSTLEPSCTNILRENTFVYVNTHIKSRHIVTCRRVVRTADKNLTMLPYTSPLGSKV